MTLRSVLAAYGVADVRPYRVGAGRNNAHWYVGAGLVLRRYGPFRSDAAIGYEHAIVRQPRELGRLLGRLHRDLAAVVSRPRRRRMRFRGSWTCPPTRPGSVWTPWTTRS